MNETLERRIERHYCFECDIITTQKFMRKDNKICGIYIIDKEELWVAEYECQKCGIIHAYLYNAKNRKIIG